MPFVGVLCISSFGGFSHHVPFVFAGMMFEGPGGNLVAQFGQECSQLG